MSNCSTASATARRKSPSPAFSSNSASTNLSSVIGSSRVLQVEVFQLHLSRLGPMATSTTPQPYTADRPENSTTNVDANSYLASSGYRKYYLVEINHWRSGKRVGRKTVIEFFHVIAREQNLVVFYWPRTGFRRTRSRRL